MGAGAGRKLGLLYPVEHMEAGATHQAACVSELAAQPAPQKHENS